MNEQITDGGPAFPNGDVDFAMTGMSLRDYFAGQAMVGLISAVDIQYPKLQGYATRAYEVADALLAERSKRKT